MADRQKEFYVDFENTPFLKTSKVGVVPSRLNWRSEMLLTRNQEAIKGKKVLDLASHDGRFSYACLKLGARHVTGVEGRDYLVNFATENLTSLGYTKKQFNFLQGDVFDYLKGVKPKEFDTILCLAFFDHTIRQVELVRELKRIQPACLILDMFIERGGFVNPFNWLKLIGKVRFRHLGKMPETMGKAREEAGTEKGRPCLVFKHESHLEEWSTIDPIDISARPTNSFVEMIFKSYGFNLKRLNWDKKEIGKWPTVRDYKYGTRASYIARPLEPEEVT